MKKIILVVIMLTGFILGGCQPTAKKEDVDKLLKTKIVEISGTIQNKSGDEWVFLGDDGELVNMASQKVDLSKYIGKKIEVTGMYSGSTLYVDNIKLF